MDVQNPYGYRNIIFSDFVECIHYLGPLYVFRDGHMSGSYSDDCLCDNMLTRCGATDVNS